MPGMQRIQYRPAAGIWVLVAGLAIAAVVMAIAGLLALKCIIQTPLP